jgi:hypothetical protein
VTEPATPDELPPLAISAEKVCYVIIKAREFEAKDETTEPDPGSNPTDDRMVSVLEEHGDDPVEEELTGFIDGLSEDEQVDLVALAWLGRGDGSIGDWDELRRQAQDAHNQRTAAYLLGIPLLPDYLEEALSAFGRSCEEFELGRL